MIYIQFPVRFITAFFLMCYKFKFSCCKMIFLYVFSHLERRILSMQYNLDLHELLVYVSMQLAVQVKLMKYQNDSYSVGREFFLMCFKFKSGYKMNLMYVSSDDAVGRVIY